MTSPFEFGMLFCEVYLDTSLELPQGKIPCKHIRQIEFQYRSSRSGKFCYLVTFQALAEFDEAALRSELEELAAQYAHQMNSVQEDYDPAA